MHVGGLQLITPPPDAPPDFVQRMRSGSAIRPRPCRPSTSARCSASAWFWTEDDDFDIELCASTSTGTRRARTPSDQQMLGNCSLLDESRASSAAACRRQYSPGALASGLQKGHPFFPQRSQNRSQTAMSTKSYTKHRFSANDAAL